MALARASAFTLAPTTRGSGGGGGISSRARRAASTPVAPRRRGWPDAAAPAAAAPPIVTPTPTTRCGATRYEPTDRVSELQSEGAYAVLAAAQELERQGRDIVHLEIGQPGFPSPPHVVEAGVDAIKDGQTKYSAPDGTPGLREAIARYVTRTRGMDVTPDQVVVGPGAKPGLFFPALALINPAGQRELSVFDP